MKGSHSVSLGLELAIFSPGVSPAAREAVLEAHLAICVAKGKLDL